MEFYSITKCIEIDKSIRMF